MIGKETEQYGYMIGQRFERLLVLARAGRGRWLCQCSCGGTTLAGGTELRSGRRKSCGCIRFGKPPHKTPRYIVEIGQRYASLTIIGKENGRWLCQCDCGNVTKADAPGLVEGRRKSCGCVRGKLTDTKLCHLCKQYKPRSDFYKSKNYACKACLKPLHNNKKRQRDKASKIEAIEHYGGKCACPGCHESNIEFLQIDHINGSGSAHRKTIGSNGKRRMYYWLKQQGWPTGFRILCANCNWSRGMYGYCPHESPELSRQLHIRSIL